MAAFRHHLTEQDREKIRKLYAQGIEQKMIGLRFGVSGETVRLVLGKKKK